MRVWFIMMLMGDKTTEYITWRQNDFRGLYFMLLAAEIRGETCRVNITFLNGYNPKKCAQFSAECTIERYVDLQGNEISGILRVKLGAVHSQHDPVGDVQAQAVKDPTDGFAAIAARVFSGATKIRARYGRGGRVLGGREL
jgi:hypothetical protein